MASSGDSFDSLKWKVPNSKAVNFFHWISLSVVLTALSPAFSSCGDVANLIT